MIKRSPNQSEDDFENFFGKQFQANPDAILATNPLLIAVIGNFIAKSNNGCTCDKTTCEDSKIEVTTYPLCFNSVIVLFFKYILLFIT